MTAEKRDPSGRFLPGGSPKSPGRPSYPQWFKDRGEAALQHMVAVAEGSEDDPRVSRMQACIEVISRVYGTAPKGAEEQAAIEGLLASMLTRASPAPPIADADPDGEE